MYADLHSMIRLKLDIKNRESKKLRVNGLGLKIVGEGLVRIWVLEFGC
jgi:hypothetical protein